MKALEGVNKIGADFKEDLGDSLKGALLPFIDGLELLIKK
jgi:hypothetical protein